MRRNLHVGYLARVEGEGGLDVRIRDGRVEHVALRIFEPPRFFEAFLRGRAATEAPDITARICGICPVAYQMSAVHALERGAGLTVDEPIRALRRLLYCGEWIESHVLHIVLLHAPDFLGYDSAIHMAKDHPELVKSGLRLKKLGNTVMEVIGGRAVHPVNVRVGGFYRAPDRAALTALDGELAWARDAATALVRRVASFPSPDVALDRELVALRHDREYPMSEGRIASTRGLDIDAEAFEDHVEEVQVPWSTALHCVRRAGAWPGGGEADGGDGAYLVGPLARFALNFERLTPNVRALAREVGVEAPCTNPFRSIVVRALEVLYAVEEASRLVEAYVAPDPPFRTGSLGGSLGRAATEAPRGLLYHRYSVAAGGDIAEARIVPPTSQNQRAIEDDLRNVVTASLDLDDAALTRRCEQAIRNHDPCISCATHFLRLTMDRG